MTQRWNSQYELQVRKMYFLSSKTFLYKMGKDLTRIDHLLEDLLFGDEYRDCLLFDLDRVLLLPKEKDFFL